MDSSQIKQLLKEIRLDIKGKNFPEARKKCDDILNSDSKNYMALLLMGASYQENDKEKAAVYLRRAVKESPENPTVALQGLSSCAEVEELPNIFGKLLSLVP
uniref:Tetratricopeptide repeat protein n=1 Tax=Megaselia scalaris TaxID=36166 RepID=T1GXD9_MEGSC